MTGEEGYTTRISAFSWCINMDSDLWCEGALGLRHERVLGQQLCHFWPGTRSKLVHGLGEDEPFDGAEVGHV